MQTSIRYPIAMVGEFIQLWPSFFRTGRLEQIRAGFPAIMEYGGTGVLTTDAAPTTAPSPICAPGKRIARAPIHTFAPIEILVLQGRDPMWSQAPGGAAVK